MKKGNYYSVYTGSHFFYVLVYSEFINIIFNSLTDHLETDLSRIKTMDILCQVTIDNIFFKDKNVEFIGNAAIEESMNINPFFCWKKIGKKEYCILVNVETGEEKEISCSDCKKYETLGSWGYYTLVRRIEKYHSGG